MTQFAESHLLRCQCGAVECVGQGAPIGTAVCYCDDCQAAGLLLQALPGAPPALEPDGGTALTVFRKNCFTATQGADRLTPHKLRPGSKTRRMVAACCNSAMYLAFDGKQHWVSTFRNRFVSEPPPIQYRHMTKFRTSSLPYPDNVRTYSKFPLRFICIFMLDWVVMKLGRKTISMS